MTRLRLPHPETVAAALLAAIAGVPLLAVAWLALAAGADVAAWQRVLADPQWPQALALSLATGTASTVLSVALAAWLLSRLFATPHWQAAVRVLAPMLAVPHVAMAIGLVLLLAPSGWILRAFSPWATGLDAPPAWPTTQDPWGLGLVLALVAKEVPFLLWAAASQLQRGDAGARWARELQVAQSLGYTRAAAWWRVVWPQLAPRLAAPILAVAAYGLTVVDVALVIGPGSPPTAAVLAWQWLLDADEAFNAQGAAAAWMLALAGAALVGLAWRLRRRLARRARWSDGRRGAEAPTLSRCRKVASEVFARHAWPAGYLAVMAALAVASVAGNWPFPAFWPERWSLAGWRAAADHAGTIGFTLGLALAAAVAALAWAVMWLEAAPARWDTWMRPLAYLTLALPALLWVVGLHRLALAAGLDGSATGLWLAHTLAVLPYALIALSPSYLGFDARYRHLAETLGHRRAAFLLRVKWPLLRAGLASTLAVGFAVSVAQYLPTQFIGAGRHPTVTTEAVALAAGGQRALLAATAWVQWLLPVIVFALAAWWGRPRRFAARGGR